MSNEDATDKLSLPASLTLGQSVEYSEHYDANLLQSVGRHIGRDTLSLGSTLPFTGVDIWNGYELSWLNPKGKPQVAVLRCKVPIDSENLIESKSFKLYLNSFNQSHFSSWELVTETLRSDLSHCAGKPVSIALFPLSSFANRSFGELFGVCIDELDIDMHQYEPNASLLSTKNPWVEETLYSDLLKSNCLITNQPDWASVQIRYAGHQIDRANLLRYLVSFRQHNEFHEQCVERIFCDILQHCRPEKLTVYARYTRRGGLDINPFRSNFESPYPDVRLPRQ